MTTLYEKANKKMENWSFHSHFIHNTNSSLQFDVNIKGHGTLILHVEHIKANAVHPTILYIILFSRENPKTLHSRNSKWRCKKYAKTSTFPTLISFNEFYDWIKKSTQSCNYPLRSYIFGTGHKKLKSASSHL